jgi:5-methylcytosine-specific restriction enzyme subunit McrC
LVKYRNYYLDIMTTSEIPIENMYYVLCYAWDSIDAIKKITSIERIPNTKLKTLANLFGQVLHEGMTNILKRGIDKDYIQITDEIGGIKGRINFPLTIKFNSLIRSKVICEFDDYTSNVLMNKILKSTIKVLIGKKELDKEIRSKLIRDLKKIEYIDTVKLQKEIFSRISIHRKNIYYRFLMNVCEFVYYQDLPDPRVGKSRFYKDLQDEERMRIVFEKFIRNFYKYEAASLQSASENYSWNEGYGTDEDFLPIMHSDVTLTRPDQKVIIIEVKYSTKGPLREGRFGKDTLDRNHLFQIFAYLKNAEKKGRGYTQSSGILLYAMTDKGYSLNYKIHGHDLFIRTLNLNQDWSLIKQDLLKLPYIQNP